MNIEELEARVRKLQLIDEAAAEGKVVQLTLLYGGECLTLYKDGTFLVLRWISYGEDCGGDACLLVTIPDRHLLRHAGIITREESLQLDVLYQEKRDAAICSEEHRQLRKLLDKHPSTLIDCLVCNGQGNVEIEGHTLTMPCQVCRQTGKVLVAQGEPE